MLELDGTAEQGQARGERDPRRVDGRRPRRGEGRRAAALPLPRRHQRQGAAGADDEHPQRRQARRQHRRLPGVHDHAGRRADVPRGAADGRRGLPQPQEGAARQGPEHRGRRRGRVRPEHRQRRRGAAAPSPTAVEKAGYKLGEQVVFALDAACTELFEEASTRARRATASSRATRTRSSRPTR